MIDSKLLEIYDINKLVVPKDMLDVYVNSNDIDKAITELREKYLVIKEVYDEIVLHDIANVKLESNISKFKGNMQISIGRNYTDEKLESQILGMKKGESKKVFIDSEPVEIHVINVKRRILAELSDEIVKKEKIENVSDVKQYKDYIYNQQVEKAKKNSLFSTIEWVKNEFINNSEFSISNEDLEHIKDLNKKRIELEAQQLNATYEEYITNYVQKCGIGSTLEDAEKFVEGLCIKTIKVIVLGKELSRKFNFVINEETYEKEIEKLANKQKVSIDDIKHNISYTDYLEKKYGAFIHKEAKDFCKSLSFNIINE